MVWWLTRWLIILRLELLCPSLRVYTSILRAHFKHSRNLPIFYCRRLYNAENGRNKSQVLSEDYTNIYFEHYFKKGCLILFQTRRRFKFSCKLLSHTRGVLCMYFTMNIIIAKWYCPESFGLITWLRRTSVSQRLPLRFADATLIKSSCPKMVYLTYRLSY